MKQTSFRRPVSDILFVLVLFLFFAGSALTVVLLGAKVYESTAARMEDNYTARTALAYVSEKVRHYDTENAISIRDLNGSPAIVLSEEIDGVPYNTWLYFHEETLRELFQKASSVVSPQNGTPLVNLKSFTIREIEADFYEFTAVSPNDETLRLLIHPKSR